MAFPNDRDQLMLELINRGRANPEAEATRLLLSDLNEGVPAEDTISSDPKQPLAWNEDLISSATTHTDAMFDTEEVVDNDFFSHTNPNVPETDDLRTIRSRITAAGYPTNSGVGENIATRASNGSLDLTTEAIENYEALFIDEDFLNRGHRVNILRDNYEEIGINNALGINYGAGSGFRDDNGNPIVFNNASLVTQDFGFVNGGDAFLTGVVYNDDLVTDDDFYTVGEGLGGIGIQAINSAGTETFTTTTYGTGGYQLQLAPDTYTVTFTGNLDSDGDSDTISKEVVIGTENVKLDIECFLTGTHILTESGEVAVEDLKIGDMVRTAEGKLEPIAWIGIQTIHPSQVKRPLRGYPVLIKAGALGDRLPHRDLYTSPDHALFVEGLLINAGALVNDVSIIKTEPQDTFVYYHIELANHSLLLAEGASTESYLPQKENRAEYDNGAEYENIYPQGSNLMLWPMDYPRVSSKNKVPRYVSQKLMAIATASLPKSA